MFGFGKKTEKENKDFWLPLGDPNTDLTEGKTVVFKHSTRCGTSRMAINRFESDFEPIPDCKFYLVNVLQERELSDKVADLSGVKHESPQVVVFENGLVVHHASHSDVSYQTVKRLLNQ